jgi:DNA polymerase-4
VEPFLTPLPVGRLPGVGKVTEEKLKKHGVETVGGLRSFERGALERNFGRYGTRLYDLARGIDHRRVIPNRPTQSISTEDTFEEDVELSEMEPMIRRLAEKAWQASRSEPRPARTVVLKLKTSHFKIITRSHTPPTPLSSCEDVTNISLFLRGRVGLAREQKFRLVGVGLSNFLESNREDGQTPLFE